MFGCAGMLKREQHAGAKVQDETLFSFSEKGHLVTNTVVTNTLSSLWALTCGET